VRLKITGVEEGFLPCFHAA
jgi:hypothetical protein